MSNKSYMHLKHLVNVMGALLSLSCSIRINKTEEENVYYRLVEPLKYSIGDWNKHEIDFQVVGKSVILKMLPEEIMRSKFLLGFCRADIVVITHLGTKNELCLNDIEKTPRKKIFRILKQFFSLGKTVFVLEHDNGLVRISSASELVTDPDIIKNLDSIDAATIGYTAAEEHYKKRMQLEQMRK